MTERPALSIVAPCLNEAENLRELHARLSAVCRKEVGESYEIVFIDDGSQDGSADILRDLTEQDPHTAIIRLARTFGHQAALSAGLSLCRGSRIFILDADLQDPPELLPAFMKALDDGADIAFGQRLRRAGESAFKRASASLFYRLFEKLADAPIPRDAGDFRLISRRVADTLEKMPERSRFLRGMMGWMGFKQTPIPYERAPRKAGQTKYPLRKMMRFAFDGITSFSVVPLRIASYMGAAFGLAALALLAYVFRAWLTGETVPGWTSLMAVVLAIGSVQLVCLGVFGEYLGRLTMETKQRPLYIVDEIVRSERVESDVENVRAVRD